MNFTALVCPGFGLHHVSALFSIERSETESEYNNSQGNEPLEFTNYQSNSTTGDQSIVFNRSEAGTLSFYIGRINYAYMDRYLLEFLIRSDASTKFAPENYWGTFPAVSAGWVISEEDWFRNARL